MKIENLRARLIQFMKFCFVGVSNVIISLGIYYILVIMGVNYLFSSICGYLLSSLSGYILNRLWVFKGIKATIKGSIVKYYVVYCSSLILNLAAMYMWVDIFGISEKIAPILTLFITVPYNFVFSKLWTFRGKQM